jgi:hypothetical protein
MSLSVLSVHQAAQDLLDCTCQALDRLVTEVPGLAGCPCRVGVVPGAASADGCDGGCNVPPGSYPGQLTVNVVRTYVTTRESFPLYSPSSPNSVRNLKNCNPLVTAVDLLITLWRCTPMPSDDGCPPSMADLDASALQLHADMLAIQQAILCCYSGTDTVTRHGRRYTVGQGATVGPQGGCVGIEQQVTVALDDCILCPPVTPPTVA